MNTNFAKIYPLYGTFAIIFASIFASFFIPYASAAGLIVGVLFILYSRIEESYYLLFMLLPFAYIFKLGSVSTSLFTMLEYVVIAKALFTRRVFDSRFFLYIMPFLAVSFISGFIVEELGLTYIVRISLNVEVLYLFVNYYYKRDSLKRIAYALTVGLLVSNVLGLFKMKIPGFYNMYADLNVVYIDWGVQVQRFCGTFTDPNYFSLATIVALGLILCLFFSGEGNLFFALSSAALVVFGLMTYSKSFIIMAALLALIPLGYFLQRGNFILLLISLFALLLIWESGILMQNYYIKSILDRFTNGFNSDITSGRLEKWQVYYNHFNSSLPIFFFGNGCAAEYLEEGAAHNIILDTWNYIGFFGVFAYFYMWASTLFSNRLNKPRLINWYLIAFVVIQYLFLNGFRAAEVPFFLMCGWLVLNTEIAPAEERKALVRA